MSNIDVKKIADSIVGELDFLYQKDFDNLAIKRLEELPEGTDKTTEQAILLSGISLTVRNHAERFTIRLIQEVLDQLQRKPE